ncbi:MAG TPA: hypothetical protein VMJ75_15210 [Candidatus Acidoferrales bacterium]|nr:hypothetical protein [Candidatus Acidoferrales bacterium]
MRGLVWLAGAPLAVVLAGALSAQAPPLFRFSIDQDRLHGLPDFSFLNRPIAATDRVAVRDGHFYTTSGQRVRFFGVNLAFGANFPEKDDAARIAKRLRRLGVNLVRLHHMDSSPDRAANPEAANSILTDGPYPAFNEVSVRRLRDFLTALGAEGIYADLNLHVGYRFRPDVDKVPAVEGGIPAQSKPVHIFYPRMVELQQRYARQILTKLRLKGDPVLAMVEINNESSLVQAWQWNQFDRTVTGAYRKELDAQWQKWLTAKRGEGEQQPGDYAAFLADTDRRYVNAIRDAVREATDAQVPVTGTQMGYGGLAVLDSQEGLDFQDNHFYIDHYNFPNAQWDRNDWRIRDMAAADNGWRSFTDMAWARQAGRPYTVSEYNQPWPNTHAAEIDPSLAAFAAFQDWDGIMHFAYSHGRNWDAGVPNAFNINGDWTEFPVIGQAAWIFRSGVVQPARLRVSVPVTAADRVQTTAGRQNIGDWVNRQAGLGRERALSAAVELVKDGAGALRSGPPEPGQLTFNRENKRLTIAAPQAAAVIGAVGKAKVEAGAIQVELAPSARGFATVVLTAMDGRAIGASESLLLSVPGYSVRSLPGQPGTPQALKLYPETKDWWTLDPAGNGNAAKPSGNMNGGDGPTMMERVEAFVRLRTEAKSIAVAALDGAGGEAGALPASQVERVEGGFRIHVNAEGQPQSAWFAIRSR